MYCIPDTAEDATALALLASWTLLTALILAWTAERTLAAERAEMVAAGMITGVNGEIVASVGIDAAAGRTMDVE